MEQSLQQITDRIKKFTQERDWAQFHNAKDLALALSIEASELNECFLWKSPEEGKIEKIEDELADILIYAILFADKYNFDIKELILKKLEKNEQKYPVEKAKGNAKKYTEFS
jgi:NTP pyrophosphatase (non-canonical NTP hydrolase)